jgi:hypothetical protein
VDARYDLRVCVGTKQTIHPKKVFKDVFHRVYFALDISDNNNKKGKIPTERTLYPGSKNQNIDLLVAVNIS